MTGPSWKNEINLGGLIQIGILLVGLGGAWAAIRIESNATRENLSAAVARIGVAEAEIAGMRISIARQDERQASVLAILGRIEARLERLDTYTRNENGGGR